MGIISDYMDRKIQKRRRKVLLATSANRKAASCTSKRYDIIREEKKAAWLAGGLKWEECFRTSSLNTSQWNGGERRVPPIVTTENSCLCHTFTKFTCKGQLASLRQLFVLRFTPIDTTKKSASHILRLRPLPGSVRANNQPPNTQTNI